MTIVEAPFNGKLVIMWLPQPIAGTSVVQQGFFDSFFAFVSHDSVNRNIFTGYGVSAGGYIASGRDDCCQKFLKTDAEWLLFLDWDITYAPEDIYTLIDAADPETRPIIAGTYVTFFGDGNVLRPCWTIKSDNNDYSPVDSFEVGAIVECSTVGMGFTLIHRSVLEALEIEYSDDPQSFFGHDIIGSSRVGEDLTFCSRARKLGFTVWAHCGILLGHNKAKTLYPQDMANKAFAVSGGTFDDYMKEKLNT